MKGKWTYIESDSLGQTIAFDEISGWLYCKDGTRYSPAEIAALAAQYKISRKEIPLEVHVIKKTFGGEIVACGANNRWYEKIK